ncbi:MAG TPA: hypothetical protein VGL55_11130 [Steroidobacteraceae bacterium]
MCLGVAFTVLLIGLIRTWRTQRYDIQASEIHPDLQAGEDLLRDALEEADSPGRIPGAPADPDPSPHANSH